MSKHTFHLTASWPGGRNSTGKIHAGKLETTISIPEAMGGPGAGTNPDEMLLGAASTCYLITLAAMIERASLPLEKISLASDALIDVSHDIFSYQSITHHPYVKLAATASDAERKQLAHLTLKAERACMISKALRGNVEIKVEADLA